jgi:hypothetical protein
MYKMADMLPSWKTTLLDFLGSPAEHAQRVCHFVGQGLALDKELEEWAKTLPPGWDYSLKIFNKQSTKPWLWPLLETSWTPRWVHECTSILVEYKWREWWMMRLLLIHAVLQSITLLESHGLGKQTWPESLANYSRSEAEHTLLTVLDGTFESMLSMLTRPLRDKPEAIELIEVCSVRGFLVMPSLSMARSTLAQTSFTGIDMTGRREWCNAMVSLVRNGLGIVKAGGITSESQTHPLHIQVWTLVEEPDKA